MLVVVRRGVFARRTRNGTVLHDATTGYLSAPGEAEEFAHPVDGADACTAIRLTPRLLASLAGGDPSLAVPDLPLTPDSHQAVGQAVTMAGHGDPEEAVVLAITGLLARRVPRLVAAGRPGTVAARRRLVDEAREILHAQPGIGLTDLARHVGCSLHHLSRLFSQQTGGGVSRYRNRIRIAEAVERVRDGATDLAALAHDLGFADQAHFTRTGRALTGQPPGSWRKPR